MNIFVLYTIGLLLLVVALFIIIFYLNSKLRAKEEEIAELSIKTEKAEKSKAAFLSNVSHELRTPMNAVIGLAQILLRSTKDTTIIDLINQIQASGNALISIIDDILDYSKLEANNMDLDPKDMNTIILLRDIERLMAGKASEKSIDFQIKMNPSMPRAIRIDEKLLKKAIICLVQNAIKFTEKGEVVLSVNISKNNNINYLNIEIQDTGCGIKDEDAKRIFLPFEQVEVTRARKQEGSGLGLAICNQIVSLMGGNLQFESKVNQGSRFYFYVPTEVVDDTPLGDYKTRATASGIAGQKTDEKRTAEYIAPDVKILLVDDNRMNLAVASGLLKPLQAQVFKAYSGAEAIEKASAEQFDLIFMDHMMPEMDGIEATKNIRKIIGYSDIPIIALTANTVPGAKEMFLESGLDDYLPKPVTNASLSNMCIKWIKEGMIHVKTE